jgi:Pyruvate/2-oxoacid:ferredoxin oxidoreductase delta subunit
MTYTILSQCIACDECRPQCPTDAIEAEGKRYSIEASLCNNCVGYYADPLCVLVCPTLHPVPLESNRSARGTSRYQKCDRDRALSPDLFPNGQTNPMASSIVIWETCNLLAGGQSLPWMEDSNAILFYRRSVKQGKGNLTFRLTDRVQGSEFEFQSGQTAWETLDRFDARSAGLHLVYAAHATALNRPWEESFKIDDRQIEWYLGLHRRKDLSRLEKLALIKFLVQQPCCLCYSLHWPQQGPIDAFNIERDRLWYLEAIDHHFYEDELGNKHVIGLTFTLRAGLWAKYFLNRDGARDKRAFYQYGILPKFVLDKASSLWQQHPGAARMMLWLLFKTKLGRQQSITVLTLMRVAYGPDKIAAVQGDRAKRKKQIRTFESDLEILDRCGFTPQFDPQTYPPQIQPMWAKLADLPNDSEAALEFWIDDANRDRRLTDPGARGKWQMLMQARISQFDLPEPLERGYGDRATVPLRPKSARPSSTSPPSLTGEDVMAARRDKGLSQRTVARAIGKSQSWVRDIERGRFQIKPSDRDRLCRILGIGEKST